MIETLCVQSPVPSSHSISLSPHTHTHRYFSVILLEIIKCRRYFRTQCFCLKFLQPLYHQMQDRIQGWDKKFISKGGKEVLLKTVAQTLPNYAMSVFLMPLELCQQLESLMCKFWWKSDAKKERGIHWKSWGNMCKRKTSGGMGFRRVRDFNIALLGNQGWRLLKYPEKLVSKVYKARYYPTGSFINAEIGHNPSYIWRSVLESQHLIKKGIGCRVGNGNSISIMNDPWLSMENDPYIHTDNEAIRSQKVSSLLNMEGNSWDVDLILDIFDARDADIILSTPLNIEVEDDWYWRKEKLGNYSVKTGYLLLEGESNAQSTAASSGFWRKLWNLKIPPKVKNFLWRASTNCLPTKDLLRSKRVQVSELCAMCNACPESVLHVLVLCCQAVSSWECLDILQVSGEYTSFIEWLQLVFQQHNQEKITIIAMVCWMLWKSRNDLIWNQRSLEPSAVVESAYSVLNQWRCVQDRTFDRFLGFMSNEDGDEHWRLPQVNGVKVNSDAAIFEEDGCYSYAYVGRDQNGGLIEARAQCLRGRPSPELAEAVGIREALSWVKNGGHENVVIESDCLQIVQSIRSSFLCFSYLGRVVKECRDILASLSSKNVKFRFVKRSANKVAHFLAKSTCSIADRSWRMGDVHPDLFTVLSNDLNH